MKLPSDEKGRVLNADLSKLIMDIFKTRTNTSDFIVASLLLLDDEKTCGNVRQTLEKEDFCKEKFIVSLSTTGIEYVAKLAEWMLRHTNAQEWNDMRNMFYALFAVLFWPDYEARKCAGDILGNCITDKGIAFCVSALDSLFNYITSGLAQQEWNDMRNMFYALFAVLFWPDYEARKCASDILGNCITDKGIAFCVSALDSLFHYITSGLAQQVHKRATTTKDEGNDRIMNNKLFSAAMHKLLISFDAKQEDFDMGVSFITSGLLVSCCSELGKLQIL
ncbi:unnamed protein product [Gongylonema pulchrum]|uniref:Condensin complex subunit 1 n=1 Tax=Gongylonema pulchrum TaxID=637853 RepID=A0A183DS96_9BILA|nr:unnamed protein product [Gongylonema pulchrum]